MENKKNSILIVITLIVTLILCGGIAYLAFSLGKESTKCPEINDKTENKEEVKQEETQKPSEDNKQEVSNNTIDYSKYVATGSKLLKTEEKEITLNGNKHKITYIYSYKEYMDWDNDTEGKTRKNYAYYLTALYDGKLTDMVNLNIGRDGSSLDDIKYHNSGLKLNVLKDKINNNEYVVLVFDGMQNRDAYSGESFLLILLENGNVIDVLQQSSTKSYGSEPYIEMFDNYLTYIMMKDGAIKFKITVENGESVFEPQTTDSSKLETLS